ncbi:hypothetical protein J2X76_005451 [Neorhizobium sp. 2083]|uniref:hypothetical protein n=1 Tax=Neorhizobium sp. 2083 TaxID=2817762 RepID=UPI00285BB495|nr:hypothetical protein [Neorhizobium sp. 2083]MDR6820254.1 hypothetical protein [Neorhizobium sp. 2083]
MSEREPTGIRSGGRGGWAVAIVLLVVAITGGLLLFEGGYLGNRTVGINVTLPKIEAPAPVTK